MQETPEPQTLGPPEPERIPSQSTSSEQIAAPSPDSTSAGTSSGHSSNKLFLGGLSWETSEETLRDHFSRYGAVDAVVVMRDRATGNPRGFGFVTFASQESASLACQQTHSIDGRTIDAKPSVPQGTENARPRSRKVFVGGIAPDTTEEQFKEYFQQFGAVAEATIMVDHTSNRSRGFGFVTFEEESSVGEIFKLGSMHNVGGKQVEVKSATPKGSGPVTAQGGRGAGGPGAGGRGGFGGPGRGSGGGPGGGGGAGGMPGMGRTGYEQYGQQGYGMPAYGMSMPPQYGGQYGGQYGYSMYGGYPAQGYPMMGYAGGAYGQPQPYGAMQAQYGGPQQQQQQDVGRRTTGGVAYGMRRGPSPQQQQGMMQMQMQGQPIPSQSQ